ncbi:MAG TPA: acriflavin resistance protein [Firmicutes bacterium]|jgi:hydrophobic/amphiphilic exporter-1 (mainly G- bacteria), HAE1 family|nr:acriflavin resistance protein [Bacillota bacterium]
MTITELSIKRPILVIVFFLAFGLIGLYGYSQLKYETMPNMDFPSLTVVTKYEGASASEIESSVTRKIEEAVSGVNNIDTLKSTSVQGYSVVQIQFVQSTNMSVAQQDVQNKINQISNSLPDDAGNPSIMKFSTDDMPVMRIGVSSNLAPKKFYTYLDNYIDPQLSRQKGVSQISLSGGVEREIKVNVDSQKLQSCGISTSTVASAVESANVEYPTGKIKDQDSQFVVRLGGKFTSIDQIKNLMISHSAAGDVKLMDVADVYDGAEEQTSISRVNGRTTIGLEIYKQSDANEVEVCQLVRQATKDLEQQYRSMNLKFSIVEDGSEYTLASAAAVKEDLVLAILLVAMVMLAFLHSLRNAIVVMVSIPTSIVVTFIGMWATGCTLNIISLLAMSLVIGILVDDSIVVLENIHHHLEKGEDQRTAALEGRNEIGFTALSITLVDVVVYLPLALVSGMIGGIVHQFALTICMSTLVSLLVSFTVTPLLASRFSKAETLSKDSLMGKFGLWFEEKFRNFVDFYIEILDWALENRAKVLLGVLLTFVLVIALIPFGFVGTEMMGQADKGQLNIDVDLPSRFKLTQTDQMAEKIEKALWTVPEVNNVFTTVGSASSSYTSGSNTLSLEVGLVDKNKRSKTTAEVCQDIKKRLDRIPDMNAHVVPQGLTGSSTNYDITYAVMATTWDNAYQLAQQLKNIIAKIPGTSDVHLSTEAGQPEVQAQLDRDKMSQLGLSVKDVMTVFDYGYEGDDNSNYKDPQDGEDYTIRVMFDQAERSQTQDVGTTKFVNSSGQVVQLNQFATIGIGNGPNELDRQDRSYAISVYAQAVGRTSGSIAQDIQKQISRLKLPLGASIAQGGMLKNQNSAFGSLGLALLAAVIFIYFIMTALYNSFIYPLSVLFSIPLAFVGAVLGLALTGNSLNVFSILGIIMQVGLVCKNAILLVDFTNRAREEGHDIKDALLQAGRERIRPILMTTLTMVLGMLPLATATSLGAEFKRGMGCALIGGLTFSMIMTLVVVPIIYTYVDGVREKLTGLFHGRRRSSI